MTIWLKRPTSSPKESNAAPDGPSTKAPVPENQTVHPDHYAKSRVPCPHCGEPVECYQVIQHMFGNQVNMVKYAWRYLLKGHPVRDLRKLIFYAEAEIARLIKEGEKDER